MSTSPANMEINDVLSSIRRLVAERRHVVADELPHDDSAAVAPAAPATVPPEAPPEAPPAVPSAATGSRLVLTAAHRIATEDAAPEGSTGTAAEWEADIAAEMEAQPLVLDLPPDATEAPPLAEAASLEETIAELEAAVADIDEPFEPDLGDAETLEGAEWAADIAEPEPRLERAAEEEPAPPRTAGFRGIMAGFEMSAPEDRLDAPIIGDIAMPLMRRGDSWRVSLSPSAPEGEPSEAPRTDTPVVEAAFAAAQDLSGALTDESGDPEARDEQAPRDVAAEEAADPDRRSDGRLHLSLTAAGLPDVSDDEPEDGEDSLLAEETAEPPAPSPDEGADRATALTDGMLRGLIADILREEMQGELGARLVNRIEAAIAEALQKRG